MKNYGFIIFIIVIALVGVVGFSSYRNKAVKTSTTTTNTTATTTDTTPVAKKEKTKIRLSEVTHSIFYAPQYVAINKGYFADEGIEIELTNAGGSDKVMTAILSGQSDIGFCGPETTIYVYNDGKEDYAQVFAQVTQRDGSFLLGREPDDDFKWTDLKGKTVLPGRKGGMPYMTFEHVLKQNGLTPGKDITLDNSIAFDAMAGAFAGGRADYVTLFEPTASMFEAEGKGHIIASVGEAGGEIAYTAYCASKSFIEKNPDLIQRFVNALYKAQQFVKNSTPLEIAKAIAPSFPDTDMDLLETVVKRYKDIDAFCEVPVLSENAFNTLQDIITEAGELEKRAPYTAIINNKFAKNVG